LFQHLLTVIVATPFFTQPTAMSAFTIDPLGEKPRPIQPVVWTWI